MNIEEYKLELYLNSTIYFEQDKDARTFCFFVFDENRDPSYATDQYTL